MISVLGLEIDIISLIPALFGAILSIYNFYRLSKPANIEPTSLVNYGIISSDYEQSFKLILPLVFHNNGARNGIIKNIKFGFRHDQKITYLDDLVKVRLIELSDDIAQLCDWDKLIEHGYRIINPTFPITVLSESSTDVTVIVTSLIEENSIPLDINCEYFIEVYFGKNKIKRIYFPFYLAKDDIPDNRLIWLTLKE